MVLMAHFETDVYCNWDHRDIGIEVTTNYSYVDSMAQGRNTKDCSLRLEQFQETDVGKWHCQGIDMQRRVKTLSFELQPGKHTSYLLCSFNSK